MWNGVQWLWDDGELPAQLMHRAVGQGTLRWAGIAWSQAELEYGRKPCAAKTLRTESIGAKRHSHPSKNTIFYTTSPYSLGVYCLSSYQFRSHQSKLSVVMTLCSAPPNKQITTRGQDVALAKAAFNRRQPARPNAFTRFFKRRTSCHGRLARTRLSNLSFQAFQGLYRRANQGMRISAG